jgi:hypothetical protein
MVQQMYRRKRQSLRPCRAMRETRDQLAVIAMSTYHDTDHTVSNTCGDAFRLAYACYLQTIDNLGVDRASWHYWYKGKTRSARRRERHGMADPVASVAHV